MKKKIMTSTTLVSLVLLIFACTSMDVSHGPTQYDGPEKEFLAREMPELTILAAGRPLARVKIISLLGNEVSVLPFPYWNVETIKINADEISLIRLYKVKKRTGPNALSAFNITFGIMGTIFAMGSQYDEDYHRGLAFSSLLAFGAVLLVGIASAFGDITKRKSWDFSKLTTQQRLEALLQIMGA